MLRDPSHHVEWKTKYHELLVLKRFAKKILNTEKYLNSVSEEEYAVLKDSFVQLFAIVATDSKLLS